MAGFTHHPEQLRRQIEAADAVLFCTPEYAGNLPGSLKNLLDWTVGGGQLYGKPAAWINVAPEGRGQGAADALASVLGSVGELCSLRRNVRDVACLAPRAPDNRDMLTTPRADARHVRR